MLAFTSFTASSMAILATFPIVESKVKIAPMFTTAGLEYETFAAATYGDTDTPRKGSNTTEQRIKNKFISAKTTNQGHNTDQFMPRNNGFALKYPSLALHLIPKEKLPSHLRKQKTSIMNYRPNIGKYAKTL